MKLKDIRDLLKAESTWDCERAGCGGREVSACHASDLVSDMLTFRGPGFLLLTGLANAQVIRAAEILDLVAICLVRGKEPQPEMMRLAQEKGIPLFVTQLSMYEACGRLYAEGVPAGTLEKVAGRCPKGRE